jgi:hypothetical protein
MMQPASAPTPAAPERALRRRVVRAAAVAALAFAVAGLSPAPAHAQDGFGGPAKVVYHADFKDPRRFSAMLTSIYNMVTTYRNDLREYDVRIVFNSHGIRFLTDDKLEGTPFEAGAELRERRENLRGRLKSLQDTYEVELELCDITRERVKLSKDKIYDGVDSVVSGVVRVAELQSKGFAYIKIE